MADFLGSLDLQYDSSMPASSQLQSTPQQLGDFDYWNLAEKNSDGIDDQEEHQSDDSQTKMFMQDMNACEQDFSRLSAAIIGKLEEVIKVLQNQYDGMNIF